MSSYTVSKISSCMWKDVVGVSFNPAKHLELPVVDCASTIAQAGSSTVTIAEVGSVQGWDRCVIEDVKSGFLLFTLHIVELIRGSCRCISTFWETLDLSR